MKNEIKYTRVFDHATKKWIEVPADTENQERFVVDKKKWLARKRYKGDVSKLRTKSFSEWTDEEKWLFSDYYEGGSGL